MLNNIETSLNFNGVHREMVTMLCSCIHVAVVMARQYNSLIIGIAKVSVAMGTWPCSVGILDRTRISASSFA